MRLALGPHARTVSRGDRAGNNPKEAAMPDEYTLRLEASGEVAPAQPDPEAADTEHEEAEQ